MAPSFLLKKTAVTVQPAQLRRRLFEIIPGTLSWGTLIGLVVLSAITPFVIAIFVIVYDLYILIRGLYLSVHLLYAYRRLAREQTVDWLAQCEIVSTTPIAPLLTRSGKA